MPTPHGTRRSPYCQRLTLLGPTPNSWATRCCAMPSALEHLAELARSCVLPPATWAGRLDHVNGHRGWLPQRYHQEEQRARLA